MSIIYKIVMIGITSAFLSAVIKKSHPEYSVAISVATSLIIFFIISDSLQSAFESIERMIEKTNVEVSYLTSILKVIGIAYISEYTGAVLNDAGETAIAKKVEMAGKIVIFIVTIPVLSGLLDLILSIM